MTSQCRVQSVDARIGLRSLIFCGCVAVYGCSDSSSVRGVVLLAAWGDTQPVGALAVHALPARNEIDRALATLCEGDSVLRASGRLEMPIGTVRIHGEGVELKAAPRSTVVGNRRNTDAVVTPAPWELRDAYLAFQARMDSLLRRTAITSARTDATGHYELPLPHRDSIELFAFSADEDRGTMSIWRDRVVGIGVHDLRNPIRRMRHVYCGEP